MTLPGHFDRGPVTTSAQSCESVLVNFKGSTDMTTYQDWVHSLYNFNTSGWAKNERDRAAIRLVRHGFDDTTTLPRCASFCRVTVTT